MSKSVINDTEAYSKAVQPFATSEEANTALQTFFQEVRELRNRLGIADVAIIVQDSVGEGLFHWNAHIGNPVNGEVMAAWHLGTVQAERQEMIREAMRSGGAIQKAKV